MEWINKAQIKVNRIVWHFIAKNGTMVVRHRELESGMGAARMWRDTQCQPALYGRGGP